MDGANRMFFERAYGMAISTKTNGAGTLSAYGVFPFSGMYVFALYGTRRGL